MIIAIWRKLKTIPHLREALASTYYFLYKNKRRIYGVGNNIVIELKGSLPRLNNVVFNVYGDKNIVEIKPGTHLSNTTIEIRGNCNKIIIAENCHIRGGCLWLEDNKCNLKIGKNTTIQEAHIGVSESESSVTIGEDCMLAHGIDIRCGDSHSIIDLNSNRRINYAKNIYIDNHVWIATNAQILKGVHIGKNSIVAAGSVVTKDVPENCIVAGIPAQVKRTNVTWLREKITSLKNYDNCDRCNYLHP